MMSRSSVGRVVKRSMSSAGISAGIVGPVVGDEHDRSGESIFPTNDLVDQVADTEEFKGSMSQRLEVFISPIMH